MLIPNERERITQLIFYGLAALFVYLVYQLFKPFLIPLSWAAVLVICFYPSHLRFERRLGRARAAFLSTLSVTFIVIAPILLVLSVFVSEAGRMLGRVPVLLATTDVQFVSRWWQSVLGYLPGGSTFDVAGIVTDTAQRVASLLTAQASSIVQNAVFFVVYLGMTIFAMFFLFRDASTIMRAVRRVLPLEEHLRERILVQSGTLITASVTTGLIVAAAQGTLGGVTFWLLGLGAPVFWGVVMGVFCLLPFGAWIVWVPTSIWLALTGELTRGLVLAGIGAGVVSGVDNVLRPMLLSGRSQINGLLLFVSILGGVAAFGALGLVLGPVLMATAVGLFDAYASDPIVESSRN